MLWGCGGMFLGSAVWRRGAGASRWPRPLGALVGPAWTRLPLSRSFFPVSWPSFPACTTAPQAPSERLIPYDKVLQGTAAERLVFLKNSILNSTLWEIAVQWRYKFAKCTLKVQQWSIWELMSTFGKQNDWSTYCRPEVQFYVHMVSPQRHYMYFFIPIFRRCSIWQDYWTKSRTNRRKKKIKFLGRVAEGLKFCYQRFCILQSFRIKIHNYSIFILQQFVLVAHFSLGRQLGKRRWYFLLFFWLYNIVCSTHWLENGIGFQACCTLISVIWQNQGWKIS